MTGHSESDDAGVPEVPDVASGLMLGAALLASTVLAMRPMLTGFGDPSVANAMVTSVVCLLAAAFVGRVSVKGTLPLPSAPVTIPLAAVLCCGMIGYGLAAHRWTAELDLLSWGTTVLFFLAVHGLAAQEGAEGVAARRVIAAAVLATAGVVALYGIYQRAAVMPTLLEEMGKDPRGREMLKIPGAVGRVRSGEVFATFVTPNAYAGYLAMLFPFAAATGLAAFAARRRLAAGASAAVALALLVALLFTGSTGGYVALAAGIALAAGVAWGTGALAWMRARLPASTGARRAAVGALCLAAAVLAAACLLAAARSAPMRVRLEYWKAAAGMIAEHPLGVGPGNFADHYPRHKTPAGQETREAHNVFLGMLAEAGPGAMVALGFLVCGFFRVARRGGGEVVPGGPDTAQSRIGWLALAGGLSGVCAAYAIGAVTSAGMHSDSIALLFAGDARPGTWIAALVHIAFVPVWGFLFVVFFRQRAGGPLARAGIAGAIGALLVHGLVEFDFKIKTTMLVASALGALALPASATWRIRLGGARTAIAVACLFAALVPLFWRGSSRAVRLWELAEIADGDLARADRLENAARDLAAAAVRGNLDDVTEALASADDPALRTKVADVRDAASVRSLDMLRRAASEFGLTARQEARRALSEAWEMLTQYVAEEPGDVSRVITLAHVAEMIDARGMNIATREPVERAIRRLCDRAPGSFAAWQELARFHASGGHLTQAAAAFERAAARYPLNPELWLSLGDATAFFDPARAAQAYGRALEVNRVVADQNTTLFTNLWEAVPVRPTSGDLAARLDAQEQTPAIAFRRGLIYWRIGGFAQAAAEFEKALAASPGDPQFAAFRALVLAREAGRLGSDGARAAGDRAWAEFLALQRAAPAERRLPDAIVNMFAGWYPTLRSNAPGAE